MSNVELAITQKTNCALCYSEELCIDDGEAYICTDRDACKKRVDESTAWREARAKRYTPMPMDEEDDNDLPQKCLMPMPTYTDEDDE